MKKEKTIEQALKDATEQEGAKPGEMKTVAVEQVAGIHVFSSDMEKPPIVLIDGEFVDVATLQRRECNAHTSKDSWSV